jgi:hypothetical protein
MPAWVAHQGAEEDVLPFSAWLPSALRAGVVDNFSARAVLLGD